MMKDAVEMAVKKLKSEKKSVESMKVNCSIFVELV